MKASDSDLKVNRNIYPDAVTCDRMRLIGPKSGQLGPITIVYLKRPNEKKNSICLHKTRFFQTKRVCFLIGDSSSEQWVIGHSWGQLYASYHM